MRQLLWSLCTFGLIFPVFSKGISLETKKEQFSYAIGIQLAQTLIRQGIDLDPDAFDLAIRDSLNGSKLRLSAQDMQIALSSGDTRASNDIRKQAEIALKTGKAFLSENKTKDGVVELPSGLQYKILRSGTGKHPKPNSDVVVHYVGSLIDGREFDSSRKRNKAITLNVSQVIKGWQEAIPLMRVSGRWQIFIPPNLAYGTKGAGNNIGPNETLIFEIELLGISE